MRRFPFIVLTLLGASASWSWTQVIDSSTPAQLTWAQPTAFQTAAFQLQLNTFVSGQRALGEEYIALFQQGATTEQINYWLLQNASLFQAQQQKALSLAASTPPQLLTYITEVDVPDNATQEMTDFLMTRADLFNRYAALHNQLTQSNTSASFSSEGSLFQQQNAAELQNQQQLAQKVAAESAPQPWPIPPPLSIPPGTSTQMQAYLTLRSQLMREQFQLHNQNLSADLSTQNSLLAQWQQQNATRFQQLQQLAQNLPPSSP